MALLGGSKYLNTAVPVAGAPVTAVATTAVPMPSADAAGEIVAASTEVTLLLSGAATTNTYRCFVLPANCVVVDMSIEVIAASTAGAVTFGVLGQNCAAVDGGTALTLDAIAANSSFTQSMVSQGSTLLRRTTNLPAVTTSSVTKNASVAVPVPYDRVIGLNTNVAVTVNDAVIKATMLYAAA